MPTYIELAQLAFDAYLVSSHGKNYEGKPVPAWDDLSEAIRQHWIAAVIAVCTALGV